MKPSKERIKLWIDDLEGGNHRQTTTLMAIDQPYLAYCCLGRLCEVALANGVDIKREGSSSGVISYDNCTGSYVPVPVSDWLGVGPYALSIYAASNDAGASFQEIAQKVRGDFDIE